MIALQVSRAPVVLRRARRERLHPRHTRTEPLSCLPSAPKAGSRCRSSSGSASFLPSPARSRSPLPIEPSVLDGLSRARRPAPRRRPDRRSRRATLSTRSWPRADSPGWVIAAARRRSASAGIAQKRRTWRGLIAALTRIAVDRNASRSRWRAVAHTRVRIASVTSPGDGRLKVGRGERRQLDMGDRPGDPPVISTSPPATGCSPPAAWTR